MPYRIVFQDVDGCLNPESGEPFGVERGWQPSSDQIAMFTALNRALEAAPVEHFVINTGRPWDLVQPIVAHFPSSKVRYILMEHACVFFDRLENRYLDAAGIARQLGLRSLAHRYGLVGEMADVMQWYDDAGQSWLEACFEGSLGRLNKVGNLSFPIPEDVDGDAMVAAIEGKMRDDLSPALCDALTFSRSDHFVDILPGVDKLDGLELVCRFLDISQSDAVAVGDFLNDLSIFEHFPNLMCPANAHPKIRKLTAARGATGCVSRHAYGRSLEVFLEDMTTAAPR